MWDENERLKNSIMKDIKNFKRQLVLINLLLKKDLHMGTRLEYKNELKKRLDTETIKECKNIDVVIGPVNKGTITINNKIIKDQSILRIG